MTEFFEANSTQLTYHGLFTLCSTLEEGLYPFFRNSHISVLYKQNCPDGSASLWTLATDSNFAKEPSIVWESLEDIDGAASRFVDGNFIASSTAGGDFAGRSAEQALQDAEETQSDFDLARRLNAEEEALAQSNPQRSSNLQRNGVPRPPGPQQRSFARGELRGEKPHGSKKKSDCMLM